MTTLKDMPADVQRHFDSWDMIGVYHPAGHRDEEGRVQTRPWVDGGDSCHFVGLYYFAVTRRPSVVYHTPAYYGNLPARLIAAEAVLKSRTWTGGYKRHPDSKHWYAEDNRLSRDQWTPMLGALAAWGLKPQLKAQLLDYAKRGLLFTTNTRKNGSSATNDGTEYAPGKFRDYSWKLPDLALFDIWSLFIRGLDLWFLYPILLLGDLMLLVNSLIILSNPLDTDVANFWVKYSLSRQKYTTPFSWLISKLVYPRLKLDTRILLRYEITGNPSFLGKVLSYCMS